MGYLSLFEDHVRPRLQQYVRVGQLLVFMGYRFYFLRPLKVDLLW